MMNKDREEQRALWICKNNVCKKKRWQSNYRLRILKVDDDEHRTTPTTSTGRRRRRA